MEPLGGKPTHRELLRPEPGLGSGRRGLEEEFPKLAP